MSRVILGNIFGNMSFISLSDIKAPLGELMRIFNLGVLAFAGGYATYTISTSAINYAKHAGPMEAQQHNAWLPARIFIGSGMLIPTLSGYSMVQVLVMWTVLQGVGLADFIWKEMVTQIDTYGLAPSPEIVKDNANRLYDKLYEHGDQIQNDVLKGSASLKQMLASAQCALAINSKLDYGSSEWVDIRSSKVGGSYYLSIGIHKDKSFGPFRDLVGVGIRLGIVNSKEDKCGLYVFKKRDVNGVEDKEFTANILGVRGVFESFYSSSYKILETNATKDYSIIQERSNDPFTVYIGASTETAALARRQAFNEQISNEFKMKYLELFDYAKRIFKNKPKDAVEDEWAKIAMQQGWVSAGLNYFKFTKKNAEPFFIYDVDNIEKMFPIIEEKFKITEKYDVSKNFVEQAGEAFKTAREFQLFKPNDQKDPIPTGPLEGAMDFVAKKAADYFNGLESITPNSTTFSESSNFETPSVLKWLFTIFNLFDGKPANAPPVNLTVVRDHMLVFNAKTAQAILGVNLIYDTDWYKPTLPKNKQPNIFHKKCKLGYKQCLATDTGIVYSIDKFLKGQRIEPLIAIRTLGLRLIATTVTFWSKIAEGVYITSQKLVIKFAYITLALKLASIAILGLLSIVPGIGAVLPMLTKMIDGVLQILYQLDQKSLIAFLPFCLGISSVYFIAGTMLAIYLPFLPFIVFIFAVIGWVLTVIEAMVAGPLIALGVTHPQGHDLLGKSEQAMMLLLGVFVRPAAIMIGFVAALYLLYAAYVLLNVGFIVAVAGYFNGTTMNDGIIMKSILFGSITLMYVYILTSVVNQVFGLTYKVPEQLMRWIGLAPEVSGASQMLGEVKQSVQSGAGQAAEGAQRSAQSMPGLGFKISKSLNEDVKEATKATGDKIKEKGKKKWDSLRSSSSTGSGQTSNNNPGGGGGGAPPGGGGAPPVE